jgi:2-haloacid dehalogenase
VRRRRWYRCGSRNSYGLELSSAERDELNEVWHILRAWPDAADAIRRLRGRYKVVVLTVLSWSIAIDCSRHNGIEWDGILSCEFLGHYKTDPPAYRSAVKLLRLEPSQAMMVAAHTNDLHAATGIGMRSAYVHRVGESPGTFGTDEVASQTSGFDVSARAFPELADMLLA